MSNPPPSIDELIAKVRDVATTLAIRLPYNPKSPPPAEAINDIKAEIMAELRQREKRGAYIIPSRDGLLVVIPSEEHESADEFVDLVTDVVTNSPAAKQFNIADMSVGEFSSSPKLVTKTVAIDKRKFYSASPSERYSLLLERMEAIDASDLLSRPVRNAKDNLTVGAVIEYRTNPDRARPQPLDYRDPFFEDNPNFAALELRAVRYAAERLAEEFGTDDIRTKYASVNLAHAVDRRYWPSYAMEYRSIPAFLRQHLTIEITRLPRGTPGGRIQEVVHRHKEFFDNIAVQVPVDPDLVGILTPFPGFREVALCVTDGDTRIGIDGIAACARRLHRTGFDVRLANVPDHMITEACALPYVKLFS